MHKRLVILHGYTASPDSHWFPWLREVFAPLGVQVTIPELPESQAPQPDAWIAAAEAAIGTPDEDLVILGHSLGCITALHALARLDGPWRLGGLVMVSGFDAFLETLPELAEFTEQLPEFAPIAATTVHRTVITAADDDIVPAVASRTLAEHLDAELVQLPSGGHFLDRDGHLTLPAAREAIAQALRLA